ncbi:hypothetical protein CO178_00845 [candidate division WWE3 bacterium CG_4_9_14_3_um_filter_34_6]|uniref:Uncharacterized protein n=1 Tax=candidate division WWE3 bacterium CG_4_9_14_3_um_filter_34_6 TaxID=1975079 RepID=A0A2M7X4R4_UNCKA|nr:MAG: hypothetical protein CO178_00845 [candidate division WWE3 bacterium CG_4_9_14_3_um_filter_34_6]
MRYKELLNYTNTWIFIIIFLASILDIFIVKSYIDVVEFILFIGWIYMFNVSSATKIFTPKILIIYIVLIPICLMFKNELSAQKLSIWVFYIFSMYIIDTSISLYKIK